ncbi:hypothetical protein FRC03_001155 [Tulasnella sp. 419]|nr:hypothetical protein FRC03_001155 [Tulasnella sp. 419]
MGLATSDGSLSHDTNGHLDPVNPGWADVVDILNRPLNSILKMPDMSPLSGSALPEYPPPLSAVERAASRSEERFEKSKDMTDLEEAIVLSWCAVVQSGCNEGRQAARRHHRLGYLLKSRFCLSRDLNDLKGAIFQAKCALKLRLGGEPTIQMNRISLDNLADYLSDRFNRLEDLGI